MSGLMTALALKHRFRDLLDVSAPADGRIPVWDGASKRLVWPATPPAVDIPSFEFVQGSPSTTWDIVHNLGKHPSAVTVYDSSGTVVHGGIIYVNDDEIIISFSAPFSGRAYIS